MPPRYEPPLKAREAQNILIIRSGALGDTLLLLPALASLPKEVQVLFAGRPPGVDFLDHAVSKTMNLDTGGWHRLFMNAPMEKENVPLPISKVDRAIVFSADRSKMLRKNLEVLFPAGKIYLFPPFPSKLQPIHVGRYLARCLQSAQLPLSEETVMETVSAKPALKGPWGLMPRHRLVIHPGSGDSKKNHPLDFWAEVLTRLKGHQRFAHLKPSLLLGPAERETAKRFSDGENPFQSVETFFSPSTEALLNLLGTAALYLGHDSGITHLSGLMGTPTVALFKNSDPITWRPLGPFVRVIHRHQSDALCLDQTIGAAETL